MATFTLRRIPFAWVMLTAACSASLSRAQDLPVLPLAAAPKTPAYEVVSIRPAADPVEFRGGMDDPDGTHIIHTLKGLVSYAYGVRPEFVACEIKWCDSVTFDIRAKAAGADVAELQKLTSEQRGLMLKDTLAERFGVKVHTEARPLRVYELVVARGGAKVHVHPPNAAAQTSFANGRPADGVMRFIKGTEIIGYAVTIESLANTVSEAFSESVERPVINETGLQGTYDFDLKWTAAQTGPAPSDTMRNGSQPGDFGPSIFTALQEQLGLKLQPATESTEIIVVDSAHMPSAN